MKIMMGLVMYGVFGIKMNNNKQKKELIMAKKLKDGDIWVRHHKGKREDWKKSSRIDFNGVMIVIDTDDIEMRKMFGDYLLNMFSQFLSKSLIDEWNTYLEEEKQIKEMEEMEDD